MGKLFIASPELSGFSGSDEVIVIHTCTHTSK